MSARLEHGDCRDVVKTLADSSIDSCVTDPPYSLVSIQKRFGKAKAATETFAVQKSYSGYMSRGFMGKQWDNGAVAFDPTFWTDVLRVLKPGAHLLAFGGTRTYHRLACAIEDAGFEIRDQIGWAFGSGFPKSHDVAKSIDRASGIERDDKFEGSFERRAGPTGNKKCDVCGKWLVSGSPCKCPRPQDTAVSDSARQWQGWGTALKPAWEPICLARKPLVGTVAANVLEHGTGAINIDGCRVATDWSDRSESWKQSGHSSKPDANKIAAPPGIGINPHALGRWPANLIHDGSEEVLAAFPDAPGQQRATGPEFDRKANVYGTYAGVTPHEPRNDSGSAARFFYTAKADKADRWGSKHPTVKPIDLIRYLARLITPPGGLVLDPFAGSGTLGIACMAEGFSAILIEREAEYVADIRERLAFYEGGDRHSQASLHRAQSADKAAGADMPLFAEKHYDAEANSKGCYTAALAAIRAKRGEE